MKNITINMELLMPIFNCLASMQLIKFKKKLRENSENNELLDLCYVFFFFFTEVKIWVFNGVLGQSQ